MKKILFVCTENVFRSFSAQILFEKYLKDNNIDNYLIDSAGTIANPWETPYMTTIYKLNELGCQVKNHKNKKISKKLLENSDIIICMSKHHQETIKNEFNITSFLFNEIAFNKLEDLKDDNEANFNNLENFVNQTIQYINDSIENLYLNLENYLD